MRISKQIGFAILIIIISAIGARAQAVVVDQLAAVVNREAITQSDIVWALALDSKIAENVDTSQNSMQMLNQLIDQSLLFEEAERLPNLEPTPTEVTQAISDLIKQFPSDSFFYQRIMRVGITSE